MQKGLTKTKNDATIFQFHRYSCIATYGGRNMRPKLMRVAIPVLMALLLILALASPAAAAITNVTATPTDSTAGATTTYTIAFTTGAALAVIAPADQIIITFPAGFNASGAAVDAATTTPSGSDPTLTSATAIVVTLDVTADEAAGAFSIVLTGIVNTQTAGLYTVSVSTENGAGGIIEAEVASAAFTIDPDVLASYTVTPAAGPYTAGVAFTVTTTGYDQYGNVVTNDSASIVTYTSNSATMVFDANQDGTFTDNSEALAAGVSVIDVRDNTAATGVTITATTGAVSGTSAPITVNPGAHAAYTVVAASPQTAGTPFQVTITAVDQYGNTITTIDPTLNGYTFTFSGPGNAPDGTPPTYPSTPPAAFAGGVWTPNVTLVRAETVALTVTDNQPAPMSGTSAAITVNPGTAASFNAVAPGTVTAGTAFNVTLTALDASGNTATAYTGVISINFTSTATPSPNGTSPTIPSPQNINFASGVGSGTGFILTNPGETPTITATDPAIPITGTSGAITVNPAAINYYTVASASYTQTKLVAFTVTVTAYDQYGNVVTTDFSTPVTMSSNSAALAFDSNGDGIFGGPQDNIKTLSAGTFNIRARHSIGSTGVTITATDPNGKTGTSSAYFIAGWGVQVGPAPEPAAPQHWKHEPSAPTAGLPGPGMPTGGLIGLWAGVAVICGLVIWLGIFRR